MVGFKTGSGKDIKISVKNLAMAKKIYDEESKKSDRINSKETKVDCDAESLGASEGDTAAGLDKPTFRSASAHGKQNQVSERALLQQANKVLCEESDMQQQQLASEERVEECEKIRTHEPQSSSIPDTSAERQQKHPIPSINKANLAGFAFSSASGKTIQVSIKALEQTKNFFASEIKDATLNTVKPVSFGGFESASGKKIEVSKAALKPAIKLFAAEKVDCTLDAANPVSFGGFESASGRKIEVSEKALDHARKSFKQMEAVEDVSKSFGFASASGKKIEVSKAALKHAKKLFAAEKVDCTLDAVHPVSFQGFESASGRKIEVSKEALDRARKTLQEHENEETLPKTFGFSMGKQLYNTKEAYDKAKRYMEDADEDEHGEAFGRGPRSVSPSARQKVKNLDEQHCSLTKPEMSETHLADHDVKSNLNLAKRKSDEGSSSTKDNSRVKRPKSDHGLDIDRVKITTDLIGATTHLPDECDQMSTDEDRAMSPILTDPFNFEDDFGCGNPHLYLAKDTV